MQDLKQVGEYVFNPKYCLGQGSFGKVYEGHRIDNPKGESYAIKQINANLLSKYDKQNVKNEYQLVEKLNHPNIVRVFDFIDESDQGFYYIVFQMCQGNLAQLKAKKKMYTGQYFNQNQAFFIASQICEAFKILNQRKIIHRDLKPQNIMLKDGVIKIGDFGLSKETKSIASNKTQAGTPLYMPLQVLKGQKYDGKYDVFTMGCIFYELIHKDLPWVCTGKQQRIRLFQMFFNEKQLSEVELMNVDQHLSFQGRKFLNNCLRINKAERWGWDQILNYYSQQNEYFKKKEKTYCSIFKNLIQGKDQVGKKYQKQKKQNSQISNYSLKESNDKSTSNQNNKQSLQSEVSKKQSSNFQSSNSPSSIKAPLKKQQPSKYMQKNSLNSGKAPKQLIKKQELFKNQPSSKQAKSPVIIQNYKVQPLKKSVIVQIKSVKKPVKQENLKKLLKQSAQDQINRKVIDQFLDPLINSGKIGNDYLINKDRQIQGYRIIEYVKQKHKVCLSGEGYSLYIQEVVFNMSDFVTGKNWNHLEVLQLQNSQVDDKGWAILIKNSSLFKNLKWLSLVNNHITTVREGELQKFQSLTRIDFSSYSGKNPLSNESIKVLLKFQQKSQPKVIVIFDDDSFWKYKNMYGPVFDT